MTELLAWIVASSLAASAMISRSQVLELDINTGFEPGDAREETFDTVIDAVMGLVNEAREDESKSVERPDADGIAIIYMTPEAIELKKELDKNATLTEDDKRAILAEYSRRIRFPMLLSKLASMLLTKGAGAQRLFAESLEHMQSVAEDEYDSGLDSVSDLVEYIKRTASTTLQAPEKVVKMTLIYFVSNLHNRTHAFAPATDQLLYNVSEVYTTRDLQNIQRANDDFFTGSKTLPRVIESMKKAIILKPIRRMSHENQTRFVNDFTRLIDEAYIKTLRNPYNDKEPMTAAGAEVNS